MTTITALELRKNLDAIVRRVQAGEHIQVTYRSKPALKLVPDHDENSKPTPGSREATAMFLRRVQARRKQTGNPVFDSEKSIKELYHEMLDNDPKYH